MNNIQNNQDIYSVGISDHKTDIRGNQMTKPVGKTEFT